MNNDDAMRKVHEYLNAHKSEIDSEEKLRELLDRYIKEEQFIVKEGPLDSYDYLEQAAEAESKQEKITLLRKALELDPENIDAEIQLQMCFVKSADDVRIRLKSVMEHAEEILMRDGFFDEEYIGDFWLVFETRPYITVLNMLGDAYYKLSMLTKAAEIYEKIIYLNNNDNNGVRTSLLSVYALLENEEKAVALYDKYENDPMLDLPLCCLYYRLEDFENAKHHLKNININFKDFKRFLKGVTGSVSLHSDIQNLQAMGGYQPLSIGQLLQFMNENPDLFEHSGEFVFWMCDQLRVKYHVSEDNYRY